LGKYITPLNGKTGIILGKNFMLILY
jgi:hypothetical protein